MVNLIIGICLILNACMQDDFTTARNAMVKNQLIAKGISDKATLEAIRTVKRHKFVPPELAHVAYRDGPLPIGEGQTISQPYIVAFMTEKLELKPHYKVLEIGTGSGYQAAVLAEIVEKVYSIEIVEPLGLKAKKLLKTLNYNNVEVVIGDGYKGLKEQAPFDAIIVTAAAETIPPPLIEQLKEGGKMIIPVGSQYRVQRLVLLEKKDGKVKRKDVLSVRFVPFTREDEE